MSIAGGDFEGSDEPAPSRPQMVLVAILVALFIAGTAWRLISPPVEQHCYALDGATHCQ
jgi:hypothetical protein